MGVGVRLGQGVGGCVGGGGVGVKAYGCPLCQTHIPNAVRAGAAVHEHRRASGLALGGQPHLLTPVRERERGRELERGETARNSSSSNNSSRAEKVINFKSN